MREVKHILQVAEKINGLNGETATGARIGQDLWWPAVREAQALGWRKNQSRREPLDPNSWYPVRVQERGYACPWWTDPLTGEDVKGMPKMFLLIAEREAEPPSEQAVRVTEALLKKPELAREVAKILSKHIA